MNVLAAAVLVGQSLFAPLFDAHTWLDHPVAPNDLTGRVVIVDVFTYSCINCKHVVPELRHVRAQYASRDLAIVGVHTPELPDDFKRSNVRANLALQGITWPVVIDNDHHLWDAYNVDAWPTQLVFDRHGRLRRTIVGDSQDDLVASTVRALVSER